MFPNTYRSSQLYNERAMVVSTWRTMSFYMRLIRKFSFRISHRQHKGPNSFRIPQNLPWSKTPWEPIANHLLNSNDENQGVEGHHTNLRQLPIQIARVSFSSLFS